MPNSLRDALETAYDAEAEEETPVEETEQETPVEAEAETPEEETPAKDIEEELPPPEEEAPEVENETEEADAEAAPAAEAEDVPAATKPPAGWRGDAKQKWDSLPADVQGEVLRREGETNTVLRESADARRFVGEFEKTIAPFRTFIEADKVTPVQAVQNLMQTAAGLRVGTPQQKAGIVTEIIRNYGIDLGTLDSMLAGETPSSNPEQDQLAQMLDQRLAPVNQFMQTLEQAKAQSTQKAEQTVRGEIEAFESDSRNVYLEDVRDDMAVLLETSAQQGREMSLDQAYDTALHMRQLPAREAPAAAPVAQQPTQSLARKKLAAASVPGSQKAPHSQAPAEDLRGALSAAWDASGQR